jgi:hypothetical protein
VDGAIKWLAWQFGNLKIICAAAFRGLSFKPSRLRPLSPKVLYETRKEKIIGQASGRGKKSFHIAKKTLR